VLDIGCGDGTIARLIADSRPDISIEGVETSPRANCQIRCMSYDGQKLPFQNQSFDVCLLVDVLHHTDNIAGVLGEASRVSRCFLLIKDHLSENALDYLTLKVMDWCGNIHHTVRTPFTYQSHRAWKQHFTNCNLIASSWTTRVPLYAFPVSLLAGRGLHFVSLLQKA
jgi:SAM-dependent methyltransferase